MSRFNNMNDEELKSFIQENQPQAPQVEANELNILKHKLNLKDASHESNSVWLWLATGLAASFFMFQFVNTHKLDQQPTAAPVVTQVASYSEEDDEALDMSIPTLDVGEDFLTLAEN